MVGDGKRVAILAIPQQELALVVGAPQVIGAPAQGEVLSPRLESSVATMGSYPALAIFIACWASGTGASSIGVEPMRSQESRTSR